MQVCAVVYKSATVGSLFVRTTFGGTLGQYEGDVQITSPTSGDLLVRNGSNVWINTAGSSVTVGKATNLAGGVASQIPYQTGAGATSFISNGVSGQLLTSNGASAPTWQDAPATGISQAKVTALVMTLGF